MTPKSVSSKSRALHFNRAKVYVRHVLTHKDYDHGGWQS